MPAGSDGTLRSRVCVCVCVCVRVCVCVLFVSRGLISALAALGLLVSNYLGPNLHMWLTPGAKKTKKRKKDDD